MQITDLRENTMSFDGKYIEPRHAELNEVYKALRKGLSGEPENLVRGGDKARGTIVFSGQPTANDTVTINGTVFTFKASGATGNQSNIGETLADTLDALVTVLNASVVAGVALATYSNVSDTTLKILFDAVGEAGNAFTLAKSCSVATLSAATLEGGNASAAISVETENSAFNTTEAEQQAFTLADGEEFQSKTLVCQSKGAGHVVVTPANLAGGTTLTFDAVGEHAVLKFLDGKWRVVVNTATLA
jgi:hypothetical protein